VWINRASAGGNQGVVLLIEAFANGYKELLLLFETLAGGHLELVLLVIELAEANCGIVSPLKSVYGRMPGNFAFPIEHGGPNFEG
jgi:hypothetical protein